MRNIKFIYVPEIKMMVSATFERKIENIKIDMDHLKRNIPEYMMIDEDTKISIWVYLANAKLFKKEVKKSTTVISLLRKDLKNIRRTQAEFVELNKELAELSRERKEINKTFTHHFLMFNNSGLFELCLGPESYYVKEKERIKKEKKSLFLNHERKH